MLQNKKPSNFIYYLNGKFVSEKDAKVSVNDLGILRGYGIFNVLRVYGGIVFRIDDYINSLFSSAKNIKLKTPASKDELKNIIIKTIEKNKVKEATIRVLITGGISENKILPIGESTLAVLVESPPNYSDKIYTKGIRLVITKHERSYHEIKTTNYISAILALNETKKKNAFDALYCNKNDNILESTTSNFFIIKNNILITAEDDIYQGVTRKVVLELAKPHFRIEKRIIDRKELKTADEAFITATNKRIMPVVKIDHQIIGDGKVGENTKKLMKLFGGHVEKYIG